MLWIRRTQCEVILFWGGNASTRSLGCKSSQFPWRALVVYDLTRGQTQFQRPRCTDHHCAAAYANTARVITSTLIYSQTRAATERGYSAVHDKLYILVCIYRVPAGFWDTHGSTRHLLGGKQRTHERLDDSTRTERGIRVAALKIARSARNVWTV